MRLIWAQNYQEEDLGFILIDARNSFNEENGTPMLWAIRHKCTSVMQFIFNCYCHWATLVMQDLEGSGHMLHSKEGVNQGEPLDMITYVIGVIPIIRELRDAHPHIT